MEKEFDFQNEIDICANINIDWTKIDNKSIMITGATGLVGKFLITVLLRRNKSLDLNTQIIAVGRDIKKFQQRFEDVEGAKSIVFCEYDVQEPCPYNGHLDMIIHMASNTHPRLYANDPIGTEMTNIFGTYYLLQKASENPKCRFVFTSSGDVYGDNMSDKEFLSETDCGYIDCNTLRAGYIEGKRASEALCNAFKEAKNVDFVTARLCRIYGSTMLSSDSKAISQFIKHAVLGEDIVLKSQGNQTFSYLYIYDVVSALLTIAANGVSGNAYNVADKNQVVSLKNLATLLAEIGGSKVVFELPDSVEKKGASSFQNVKLDSTKLEGIGWKSEVGLVEGLRHTINEMRK